MNSLVSGNLGIEERSLNQDYYFQSLLGEAAAKQLLTSEQIERLQYSLLELMAKEVDRYTNGESSSVPIEKAQELLQSITYLIGAYLKTVPDMHAKLELLKTEPMSVLFYRGLDEISRIKKEAMEILLQLQKKNRRLLSISYQDTLYQGLPEFFHDYNLEYAAHELPGSIDYPLLIMAKDYLGVELIAHYLQRLDLEDQILSNYSMDNINRLLRCFDREAKYLLINICELVLINSIGCIILEKSIKGLDISGAELHVLQKKLVNKDKDALATILKEAMIKLGEELVLAEEPRSYLMTASRELTERLWNCISHSSIHRFFVLTDKTEEVPEELYVGSMMEDEKLRELMEALNLLNSLDDKVAFIREQVRSIYDLTLLIEECIYPEEYTTFFSLLGEEELILLKKWILSEAGGIAPEDYEPEKAWQKYLIQLS